MSLVFKMLASVLVTILNEVSALSVSLALKEAPFISIVVHMVLDSRA